MTTSLLLPPEQLDRDEVEIGGDRYRHLFRARRQKVGDRIRLVDGKGRARWARVVRVDRRVARLELAEEAPGNEPKIWLELVVVPPRSQRLTWMVEKTTEIGVSAIRLIHSARGPRKAGEGTLDRLRRVASAAVMQSHRSLVPEISGVHDWRELASVTSRTATSWTLDPSAERAVVIGAQGSASLLVGPEGGWDEQELRDMEGLECRSFSLGPRTLRTETAAVVGSALLLASGCSGV